MEWTRDTGERLVTVGAIRTVRAGQRPGPGVGERRPATGCRRRGLRACLRTV